MRNIIAALCFTLVSVASAKLRTFVDENKSVDETHVLTVSDSVEYFVKFEVPENLKEKYNADPDKHIFQVDAKSSGGSERYPVDISVRQFGRLVSFQLPYIERRDGMVVYSRLEKSFDLCPLDKIDSDNSVVTISITTDSAVNINVSLTVTVKGPGVDWTETEDQNGPSFTSHTTIHPSKSEIRFFDTHHLDTDSIIVKVKAQDDSDCLCSLISIQQPTCPFYHEFVQAQKFGIWSTMLDQGTVILHPWEFPNGFIIVLVASPLDDVCGTSRCSLPGNVTDPVKTVTITVGSNGSDSDYAIATMAVISFYLAIIFLTLSFSLLVNFRHKISNFDLKDIKATIEHGLEETQKMIGEKIDELDIDLTKIGLRKSSRARTVVDGLKVFDDEMTKVSEKIVGEIEVDSATREENRKSLAFIDNSDAETLDDDSIPGRLASVENFEEAVGDDNKTKRMKTYLFVNDLSCKLADPTRTKSVYQKSQLYLGILFLVSLFYSLPTLQMVFAFSWEQGLTGNQDICYYNDLCRKPLGLVRDFNHVFSNLGYCAFGLLFMGIVLIKQLRYQSFLTKNTNIGKEEFGVPTQYPLYYAMGLALFMEGVMSSCYHVCPTNITFQFDTTFMYLIAILMFMKLYQVRHSDISANAVGVFFGLGVALFLETISIYYSGPVFWLLFCTVYFLVIIIVSVHAYNIGIVKYDHKILFVVIKILAGEIKQLFVKNVDCEPSCNGSEGRPRKAKSRLICLLLMASVNMALCMYYGISGTPGASNYLLTIFFLNLALYGSYYCTMKLTHGETLHFVPLIYATLGLLCFLPSLYFFTQAEKKTEISPSESRELNRECVFLNFFDGHDIWHFLGGAGVFFAFLFILTLDEDVKYKQRSLLHVF